jgi:dynein assembly factor 6, axonemal
MSFSIDDLESLKNIIAPDTEEEENYYSYAGGSTLTPGDIGGGRKETAPAHSKIEAKVNRKDPNQIWKEEDLHNLNAKISDDRPEPEYEILYKQRVAAEDVYLGLSDLDPSSRSCQDLLIKIKMPGTKATEITLDTEPTMLKLQAPNFALILPLPHTVKDKDGNAKWDAEKSMLTVSLPIVKEEI